jgi:hypothetical protein
MSSPEGQSSEFRVRDLVRPPFGLEVVWLVLPFALALICFGLLPLRSWDYWWHLSIGRLIDAYGAVPDANHFLYTMEAEAPSFIQPWISQWLLFWIHDLGGLHVVLIVRNLLAALVFGAVGVAAIRRSKSAMYGALLALLGFLLAFQFISARTHMFVWPLFGLLLWVGGAVRARSLHAAAIVCFPGAAALWANLHGSFLIPAAICLAFVAATIADRFVGQRERSWRRPALWTGGFVASLLSPLLNPRGAEVYGYVADLMGNAEIQNTVTEWMPTTLWHPAGIGVVFWAVVAGGLYLFWRNRRRLDAADVFLFAGFALMGAMSTRALLWFGIAAPVALAAYLPVSADADDEAPSGLMSVLNLAIALAVVAAGVALQPGTILQRDIVTRYQPIAVRTEAPLAGLVTAEAPVDEVELLRTHRQGVRLFHDQKYAGFLIFHLSDVPPHQLVFVDQRIELPPSDVWRLYEAVNQTSAWKGVFHQYGVDAAVLNRDSQAQLIERLGADDGWMSILEDEHNALFVREAQSSK